MRVRSKIKGQGYIYFIQAPDCGPVKIGFTTDHPKRRLTQLQTGSPVELTLRAMIRGTHKDELSLHAQFAANRLHGEWFTPHPDMPLVCCDGEIMQPRPKEADQAPRSLLDEMLNDLRR
jgi:hypothetical protein